MSQVLTAEQAQAAGTNRGRFVQAVRRGSPAYQADVLPGDIVLTMNGIDANDTAALGPMLAAHQPVSLVLRRNGQEITKVAQNPATW